jgi:transglutaminase-like putative cysteine protease
MPAPPLPQRNQANRIQLPDDWNGIRFQIGRMTALVKRDLLSPVVVGLARAIVLKCPSRDLACEAGRIFEVVGRNMRFVEDPRRREVIQSPDRMARALAQGLILKGQGRLASNRWVLSGDCDEHACLTAGLAGAIGLPCAFGFGGSGGRAIVAGRQVPTYHHVWGEAQVHGRWIPLDTTGGKRIGEVWPFQDRARVVIA